jgi:hypothetical protein
MSAEELEASKNGPIACRTLNLDTFDPSDLQHKTIADRRMRKKEQCTVEPWIVVEKNVAKLNPEYNVSSCTFEGEQSSFRMFSCCNKIFS